MENEGTAKGLSEDQILEGLAEIVADDEGTSLPWKRPSAL